MEPLRIDSAFVGKPWRGVTRHSTWRDTTNYAAAVGDLNPVYFDDEREDGLIAPPLFAVTLGWPLIADIHEYIDLPYPKAVFHQLVHYTTFIDFNRLIVPDTRVHVQGDIAAIAPHRSGTECVFRFRVSDEQGEPYHTEYMGCVLRDVTCTDDGKGMDEMPRLPKETFDSPPRWQVEVHMGEAQAHIYDGCTGIVNPIHTSPRFAHSVGLPDPIIQGTLTIATGVKEVIDRELACNPLHVRRISAKLTGMVFGGDVLDVQLLHRHETPEDTTLYFQISNRRTQQVVLSYGSIFATR